MPHDSRPTGPAAQHLLPRPNYKLTELAEEVARCAQPLLPAESKLFLGLQQDDRGSLRLIWWRAEDFRAVAEIESTPEGFCPEDSDEGILQDAAAACLTYLAGRWPSPPRRLGMITDGTGVAFSPARPAVAEPGWLLAHAGGDAPLTAIVPLDPRGPCALLCTPSDLSARH
ncbi:hypothetical protein [Sphingomonas pokkalii]|uniref:Uncharacterized protein n=1 Tax=Sphingomonas pokkalii TaxID=2175090 RepID=A0A2U0SG34_9SPHN|nr:hypothetical protein [Sphingomonas pokkalii]PVX30254.1 hypothetical protein DD559_13680 [Sphingomonas pokkalii]